VAARWRRIASGPPSLRATGVGRPVLLEDYRINRLCPLGAAGKRGRVALGSGREEEALVPFAEANLDEVEEITPQQVSGERFSRERNIQFKLAELIMHQADTMGVGCDACSGTRLQFLRFSGMQFCPNGHGKPAIEQGDLRARIEKSIDVERRLGRPGTVDSQGQSGKAMAVLVAGVLELEVVRDGCHELQPEPENTIL
jgi:hypothetical protein